MSIKRLTSFKLFAVMLLIMAFMGQSVYAAADKLDVKVFLNGKTLQFKEQNPVVKDGTTLVPFRTLFEALGFQVTWNSADKQATGTKDGLELKLTIDSKTAKVNGKDAKLSVPAQMINGKTLVPLRFVSENSGAKVSYSNEGGVLTIQIMTPSETGVGAGAESDKPEPYVVKGRVVNSEGKPVAGALVTADNQLLYNSNAQAKTNADGRYRIPLGMLAATYLATAEFTTEYEGKKYTIELVPDDDSPFAGNEGAIRNFTLKLGSSSGMGGSGHVLFYMMDLIHPLDPIALPPDRDHVVLTLTPDGPQLDGSTGGKPIVGKGEVTPEGFGLSNVPIGRYKITATYAPPGETPQQMLVRKVSRGKDNEFTDSVTTDFDSITSKIYKIELELKLNVTKQPDTTASPDEWTW